MQQTRTHKRRPTRALVATALAMVVATSGQALSGAAARAAAPSNGSAPDAVITWNANAVKAAQTNQCLSPANHPLHEARMYAMMHVAIHDALNAIDRRAKPYIAGLGHHPNASPDATVASAARNVLVPVLQSLPAGLGCVPDAVTSVENDYAAALAAIPAGPAKTEGIGLGKAAAAAIVAQRSGDGSDTPVTGPCPTSTDPGVYQCTPGTPFVFAPGWGQVKPFVLTSAAQFRPGPPPSLKSSTYTKDFKEVKRLGGDDVTTPSDPTPDETEIALFWVESSPSLWNRIARTVAAARGLDLWENARLFALVNLAMADGYIGTFDTKYLYNFWRPVTAIRAAATDGNPTTSPDRNWTPLLGNPPIPDYDSGHAVEGGTAAEAMKRVLGTDRITFKVCSLTLPTGSTCNDPHPVLRRYTSFTQAAEENGLSRILVGFHFRTAVRVGTDHGRKIADRAVDKYLRPSH